MRVIAPTAFRRSRVLHGLCTIAIGLSLAAATAGVLAGMGIPALPVALSTVLVGCIWAARLRRPGRTPRRWLTSIPFAALNAGLACGLLAATEPFGPEDPPHLVFGLLGGGMMGLTFGIIVWAPALAATLMVFGLPISHAIDLRQRGLAGEDRGEFLIGFVSAVVALITLVPAAAAPHLPSGDAVGLWGIRLCALLGTLTGISAALFARARERRRRAFVRMAETGLLAGYRVDGDGRNRVLVHVPERSGGYRVAQVPEPICVLDEGGEALRLAAAASENGT